MVAPSRYSRRQKGSVFVPTIPHILGPHGTGPTHTQQRRHDGADSCQLTTSPDILTILSMSLEPWATGTQGHEQGIKA